MAFIVDASVAACWAFDDESHPWADQAMAKFASDAAEAPGLWWFEVRNTLIVNERRGRIAEAGVSAFLQQLSRLGVSLDRSPDEAQIMRLARTYRLTVYDAAYVELALRKGAPLATLDSRVVAAAQAESVGVIGLDA
jgi:predicted nucleic acid-binding protein